MAQKPVKEIGSIVRRDATIPHLSFIPIVGRPLNLDGVLWHPIHTSSTQLTSSYHDSPRTRVAPHSLELLQCLPLFFILQLNRQHISIAKVSSVQRPRPRASLGVRLCFWKRVTLLSLSVPASTCRDHLLEPPRPESGTRRPGFPLVGALAAQHPG
ncbi:hypothetical protein B0H65DRAFT_443812 [Neurospora tetraspora]|uniref:Uncharacterized protein n=1 Tax=Neurospora tetraspora TaxID=94610 RepID=A0AAE0MQS2_9PEZI|nr:hypothetical protein B0H65DRAFT_443812 [Neurospora tetraspora]